MKKSFIALAAACVALAACNKEQNPAQNIPMAGEPVNVSFSLRSAMTKAATTEEGTLNENKINRVDAFVFNADGTLDGYKKFDGPSVTAGASSEIQVKATTGVGKRFVAIINAAGSDDPNLTDDKMEEVDHINDLNSLTRLFQLRNNTRDGFQMYGAASQDLVSGDNTVPMELNRAVARVKVDKITRQFEVPSLAAQTFKIKRMYLSNVVGSVANVAEGTGNASDSKYFNTFKTALGDIWYNKYAQEAGHRPHAGYINFTDDDVNVKDLTQFDVTEGSQTLANGESYEPVNGNRFYAMPNDILPAYEVSDDDDAKCLLKEQALQGLNYWADNGKAWKPELTKLVIETELAGKTYYYVIPIVHRDVYPEGKITNGINFNETFNFKNIVLTRAGSEDPDTPVSTANVIYDLEILPWTVQTMATNGEDFEI